MNNKNFFQKCFILLMLWIFSIALANAAGNAFVTSKVADGAEVETTINAEVINSSGTSDESDLTYRIVKAGGINGEDIACVTGGKPNADGSLVIPSSTIIDDITYPVTQIADYAFNGCIAITSIEIPESVMFIGGSAFRGCTALISLTFNAINCGSFSRYSEVFPSSIRILTIGDKVETIPDNFLRSGSQIESMTIPNSVTSIGEFAFFDSNKLKSLIFNAVNCSSVGESAFPPSISILTIGNNVTTIPDNFLRSGSQIESITIPNSVTSIGKCAFFGSNKLKSLTLGSSLISIGSNAFYTYLFDTVVAKLDIPKVFWLGNTPPSGYEGVKARIHYVANEQYSLLNPNIYQFLSSKFLIEGVYYVPVSPSEKTCVVVDCDYSLSDSNLVIPEKVTFQGIELAVLNVNSYSFYSNQGITSLRTSHTGGIGTDAFYNCDNLVEVTANHGGNIGILAFDGCDKLVKVTADHGGNIDISAFNNCGSLTTVIATNDGNIGRQAFYNCGSLTTLTLSNNGSIGDEAFRGCNALPTVIVNNNGSIGQYAFAGTGLNNIRITNKGDVQASAFSDCGNLETVYADNVGIVSDNVFMGCSRLKNVVLGDSVTAIGDRVFYNCSSLPSISLPDNIAVIGEHIFEGCSSLTDVKIGAGIRFITQYSFANCSSLKNLSIPGTVRIIDDHAFSGCKSLTNLTFEEDKQDDFKSEILFPSITFTETSSRDCLLDVKKGDVFSFNYEDGGEREYHPCYKFDVSVNGSSYYNIKKYNDANGNHSCSITFTQSGQVTVILSYGPSSPNSQPSKVSIYDIKFNSQCRGLCLYSNGDMPLFSDCPLEEVHIGRRLVYNSDSKYGYSPFYCNKSLQNVEITDAENEIYHNEFYSCSNLKTLKIGNGVTKIGDWAFSGCSSLDYFSAGYNVKSIGNEAFSDCTALKSYYSYSIQPPVCGTQALDDINKWDCTLYVPSQSIDEYKAANQWKDFFFINENGEVLIENIRLNTESINGKVGDTFQLTAEVLPDNATSKKLVLSSSNPSVATVDENGLVTLIEEGTAIITVKSADGSEVESSVNVEVVKQVSPELPGDENPNPPDVSDLTYRIVKAGGSNGEDIACVTGGKPNTDGSLVIPSSTIIGGVKYPVTIIGEYAFRENKSITSIFIPQTIIDIGLNAFIDCSNITAVNITDIKAWCGIKFHTGSPFTAYSNPLIYGHKLFLNDKLLTDLVIPEDITTIRAHIFAGCTSIKNVIIPDPINKIEGTAFYDCTSLEYVSLPSSLSSIGEWAFKNCFSLKTIICEAINPPTAITGTYNSFTEIGNTATLYVPDNSIAIYKKTAPWSRFSYIESIGNTPDKPNVGDNEQPQNPDPDQSGHETPEPSDVSDLTYRIVKAGGLNGEDIACVTGGKSNADGSLVIPSSTIIDGIKYPVTQIADYAFNGCDSINSVFISQSITMIGKNAFHDCDGLTKAEFASIESLCNIGFETITSNPLYYAKHLYIGSEEISDVIIPNTFSTIGDYTFAGGSSIASIQIPNSVITIGKQAFHNCLSLTTIEIPNSVTSIGFSAFEGCSNLIVAEFESIEALCNIEFDSPFANPLRFANHLYIDGNEVTEVHIPESTARIHRSAFNGGFYLTTIEIPNSVTEIGEFSFALCFNISKIEIPSSVTKIESCAFQGCIDLSSIEIPNSVSEIGWNVFTGCSSLKTVKIGSGITSWGSAIWSECKNIVAVYYSAVNPIRADDDIFPIDTYYKATLYVPTEAVEKAKTINPWKNFKSIQAYDFNSGIDEVTSSDDSNAFVKVYNLSGVKVFEGLKSENSLPKGLYIINNNGNTSKVFLGN